METREILEKDLRDFWAVEVAIQTSTRPDVVSIVSPLRWEVAERMGFSTGEAIALDGLAVLVIGNYSNDYIGMKQADPFAAFKAAFLTATTLDGDPRFRIVDKLEQIETAADDGRS